MKEKNVREKDIGIEPQLTQPIQSVGDNGTVALQETVFEIESPKDRARKTKPAEDKIAVEWDIGDVILDLYKVTDILGEGGMGKVYKVHHQNWNMDLAVKSPLPKAIEGAGGKENFVREAETWVNLGLHPNTVSCYYVRTLGDIPRVFAEFVEGGSLKDWIDSRKLYESGTEKSLKRILDIAIQFAWGLDYAHEQGLVHQDIKPANVMMAADGTAKITDFGLAKARPMSGGMLAQDSNQSILVTAGGMTEAYCSPEQYAGKPLNRKTDIWSWAVSILEMFTGEATWRFGFAAAKALESYIEHGANKQNIPEMPTSLTGLLKQCFQDDPKNRPATIAEIVNTVKAIYEEVTGKGYFRPEPKSDDLRADSLNNHAISYLDLNREDDAIRCWQMALSADPLHLGSTFNYGYLSWKKKQITDVGFLTKMKELENSKGSDPDYWRSLGWIYLESGNIEELEHLQKSEFGIEDEAFRKAFNDQDRPIGRHLRTFDINTGEVLSVGFSPDGNYFLSGGSDQTIALWEVLSGKVIRRFGERSGLTRSVCFSPDGNHALSIDGKFIRLWNILTGEEVIKFQGHTGRIHSACFSPDGKYILSGGEDTARLWKVSNGTELIQFGEQSEDAFSVCFSPDGRYAIFDRLIRGTSLWEVETGQEIRRLESKFISDSVCFSPDGHYVIQGCRNNNIYMCDVSNGKVIKQFKGHTSEVKSVCISPDGRFILSGSGGDWDYGSEFSIRLWEVNTGRQLRQFEGHKNSVTSLCFSPKGRYAISGSRDKSIKLWEVYYPVKDWGNAHIYPLFSKVTSTEILIVYTNKVSKLIQHAKNYM